MTSKDFIKELEGEALKLYLEREEWELQKKRAARDYIKVKKEYELADARWYVVYGLAQRLKTFDAERSESNETDVQDSI